jgi:hypothetical protein
VPLQYTICFCLCGELILMLYRNRPPNRFHWNGLGGKLQKDETPQACVLSPLPQDGNVGRDVRLICRMKRVQISHQNMRLIPDLASELPFLQEWTCSPREFLW